MFWVGTVWTWSWWAKMWVQNVFLLFGPAGVCVFWKNKRLLDFQLNNLLSQHVSGWMWKQTVEQAETWMRWTAARLHPQVLHQTVIINTKHVERIQTRGFKIIHIKTSVQQAPLNQRLFFCHFEWGEDCVGTQTDWVYLQLVFSWCLTGLWLSAEQRHL